MSYSQYLRRVSIALTTTLLIFVSFIVYVDPFQIFHKSYIADMGLSYNQRYQNAGLINSYLADADAKYDSVMIGTSLSENFSGDIAAKALVWHKTLRLFVSGGTQKELAMTLEHALNTQRVQHVLWELNPRTYSVDDSSLVMSRHLLFPSYLYNKNYFDDLRYVFNIDTLRMSWKILQGDTESFSFTPDTMGYWNTGDTSVHDDFNAYGITTEMTVRTGVSMSEYKNLTSTRPLEYPVLRKDVIPLLKKWCNTGVEFVVFNAPLSKMAYVNQPDLAYHSINMTNYLLKHTQGCQNIRIHAFDTMNFTFDMNNYKDSDHYGIHISKKILDLMGKHQGVITTANVSDYENMFIKSYDEGGIYTSYPNQPESAD